MLGEKGEEVGLEGGFLAGENKRWVSVGLERSGPRSGVLSAFILFTKDSRKKG